ncbi:tetratricopeptide repeat protein [candidate division KSB1 bacterium]|nr:tetratricopeptide repeat protein [candidate division KSB1 bacterium]
MTFAEAFTLLLLVAVVALGAYLYMQRRESSGKEPISPYTEGLRAVLEGDRFRAAQKLRESVARDSSNVDAYLRLGVLAAETGDLVKAIKIHRALTFRADLTQLQKAEVYRALAEDFLKSGDQARALEAVEHVLSLSKKDQWSLERKMALHIAQQDWNGAFEAAERLASAGGSVSARRLAVLKTQDGMRLCRDRKERDGRIQYREAIKHDPTLPAPYLYWGDSYIRESRTEDAVKIWKRLLEMNPERAHLVFERLETHLFDLGRFSEIEQIYRGLTRSNSHTVHAFAALSRFLEKRGDRSDAVTVLNEGLAQNPDSLWLRRRLVQIYADVRDVDRVMSLTRDLLSRVMHESYEFKCDSCGNISLEPLWLCPKCNQLDTYHA